MVSMVAVEFLQLGNGQLSVAKLRVLHEGTVDKHVLLLLGQGGNNGKWLGSKGWEEEMRLRKVNSRVQANIYREGNTEANET